MASDTRSGLLDAPEKHLPDAVGAEQLGEEFVRGVDRWRAGITFFATHYALTEAPRYRTHDGETTSVAMGAAVDGESAGRLPGLPRRAPASG